MTNAESSTIAHIGEQKYHVKRKILKLFGGEFYVWNESEDLVMYSKMKAFKLKEDIRIYTDEGMLEELLTIKARNVIDLGATYDVVDAKTGDKIGALRRKALKSFIQDEWLILNEEDGEVGKIVEDSTVLAIIRRFVSFATLFMPQKYHIEICGEMIATLQQNRNPLVYRLNVDFSMDASQQLDKRLGIAAAILLAAIEGKQG
ncbi:hypothetical protein KS4_17920 [Poriferisphaera corsica]|uniref:Uncharacterized protein n=1 Tax=Poriferisphaera corsica TaxID=2528020 RepID=A0A517YU32_9BACT|nr:hypothetical protein [Poriferisphaera corsica]QDU33736.1 hypothetical protein KS4_17920 [Poriferisphaera corsica]